MNAKNEYENMPNSAFADKKHCTAMKELLAVLGVKR
jgi:hypothetical protein